MMIFQAGGALPTAHPSYVERTADRNALVAATNADYVHVIAPRQIGKTSLLRRLATRLTREGWRCAYVDLSTLMGFGKSEWYAEFGRAIAEKYTPDYVPTLDNQIQLRSYLINKALADDTRKPQLALLLDEVESLAKTAAKDHSAFADPFWMTLRNLYIQREDYAGDLIVAMAGAMNPENLVEDQSISPFNVGQELELDDFSPAESSLLVGRLAELKVPVESDVPDAIYAWSNGQPYLTQRVCSELESQARSHKIEAITVGAVNQIVEQVILSPTNPSLMDKNVRHILRTMEHLSPSAMALWGKITAEQRLALADADRSAYWELYLAGVVQVRSGVLRVRNRIYEIGLSRKTGGPDPSPRLPRQQRPSNQSIRVFLSSTWLDLQPEREAVEKTLHRMHDTTFNGMEYFGSRSETPTTVSLDEVDRSDVYLGIIANRYGSGITEMEYRRARQRGIPILIYFKDKLASDANADDADPQAASKLRQLKQEIRASHVISEFRSPDQLAGQVAADLHNLLGSAPSLRTSNPRPPSKQLEIADRASDLRPSQLADNVRQDLNLLKDYEDALRYEDDPRRRAKYMREIENLHRSAASYREEYRRMQTSSPVADSQTALELTNQLQEIDRKLDGLLVGQGKVEKNISELRLTLLSQFDQTEKRMLSTLIQKLDENQLGLAQAVIAAAESQDLADRDIQDAITQLLAVLQEIREHQPVASPLLSAQQIDSVIGMIESPKADLIHKLKITAPIVPFVLSYEAEVDLKTGINLKATWDALLSKIKNT